MKYRVIGWADEGYGMRRRRITTGIHNAVVRNVRINGYLFGGDQHESYLPVLNDGTYAEWSWRGWGGIIAEAHKIEPDNPQNYSLAYMNEFIKEPVYPDRNIMGFPAEKAVPQDEIAETYKFEVTKEEFAELKSGKIPHELPEKLTQLTTIDEGDYIELCEQGGDGVITALAYVVCEQFVAVDLPTDTPQGYEVEVNICGKPVKLKACTDRLTDKSVKPLYAWELAYIIDFVQSRACETADLAQRITDYAEYRNISYDGPLTADDVEFYELCVVMHSNNLPLLVIMGYFKDMGEEIYAVFYDGKFVGVCDESEYKNRYTVEMINEWF